MLKNSTKVSHRRIRRKVQREGLKQGIVDITETAGREFGLPLVVSKLNLVGKISIYNINDLYDISESIHQIKNYEVSYEPAHDVPFVALLPGGYLLPNHGILLDENLGLVNAMLRPMENSESVLIKRLSRMAVIDFSLFWTLLNGRLSVRPEIQRLETAAPLFPYYTNYYHWLVKTLPKVRYVQHFEAETGRDVPFLLPGTAPSWVDETLELLGVPDEKIIHPKSDIYHVESMVAPSWVSHSVDDYNWLKETMLNTDQNVRQDPTNILISRRDATDRHLTNRTEVMEILSEYGFEEVVLSDIPVKKCIDMFNHADIIVGAHGAGFADIVFAEDASVIELYGSRYTNTYNNISQRLGLDYTKIKCDPVYGDILVDTDELEVVIQNKLNKAFNKAQ